MDASRLPTIQRDRLIGRPTRFAGIADWNENVVHVHSSWR
jgi:hypothetical protein